MHRMTEVGPGLNQGGGGKQGQAAWGPMLGRIALAP
jgi:hypothetical protein